MDGTTICSPSAVIEGVRAARVAEHAAALCQLELAVAWARLHPCPAGECPAHWGDPSLEEDVVALAGAGAPLVAQFAPVELGAALGMSLDAARQLLADALELAFRLPRLWALARDGAVPVWRARLISRETHDLGPEAVAYADRLVSATPAKIGLVAAARLVAEARLYFDPDRAVADEEEALARRGVWLHHGRGPATTEVTMTLDTDDARLLDSTVGRIAADLRDLGDPETLEVRRARAVGILADPQHALDLMSGRDTTPGPGPGPGSGSGSGVAYLHLHLTPADLDPQTGTGAATVEGLGAATTALLTTWLTRFTATGGKILVRPVLDLASPAAVDQHDPPATMRETVTLRDAHCVFPGCRRDSRACDLDHIDAYTPLEAGGPPGQTRAENLAPLCRTHHRVKTHTDWTYQPRGDGYTWTSPTGHHYDVTRTQRRPPTHRPPARRRRP